MKRMFFNFNFQVRMFLIYFGQKQGEPKKIHSDLDFFFVFFLYSKSFLRSLAVLGSDSSGKGTVWFYVTRVCQGVSHHAVKGSALLWEQGLGRSIEKHLSTCRWKLPLLERPSPE